LNLAADPHGNIKDALKMLIRVFVTKKRVTTDEEISLAMNQLMSIQIPDLNILLQELVDENQLVSFPLRTPLEHGNFGRVSIYAVSGTVPA
jgi:hypothetical protein